jgi:photosystem II stability/assembly factor-like uncharacterized protein
VLITTDGGDHWYNQGNKPPLDTLDLISIYAVNINTSLITSTYFDVNQRMIAELYRTSDRGQHWSSVLKQNDGYIDHFILKDSLNGFLLGDPVQERWSLWTTTNGGVNWDSSGLYLPDDGGEKSFNKDLEIEGDNIWFGTNNYRIYYSNNFGRTWNYSPVNCPIILTLSVSANLGFAAEQCIFKTTNAGLNWNNVTLPYVSAVLSITHIGNEFWWYARQDRIYYSSDMGNNFNLQYSSPDNDIYWQISLKKIDNLITGWAIRDGGGISKYSELIGIKPILNDIPSLFNLYQNYPNPFNPVTKIKYDLPRNTNVTIKVYDLLGREVTTLINNEFRNAGRYEVSWNASNYASGVYIYRIKAGDFVSVKKMVLIK